MKHLEHIKSFVKLLTSSDQFNALIVQSPPGWAKSTTINEILTEMGINYFGIGSYSTPLAFYNALCEHNNELLVLDDSAGLFDDLAAMAVLKAATWPASGTGAREVTWNSTSGLVRNASVIFTGKLILLTNVLPKGQDTEAFLSRCLYYNLHFNRSEVAKMLKQASKNPKYYPNQKLASGVADFLISQLYVRDYTKFNLRTLRLGYELAEVNPKNWKEMIERLLPQSDPKELVRNILKSEGSTEDHVREFMKITGMGRRVFFNYKADILGTNTTSGPKQRGRPKKEKKVEL